MDMMSDFENVDVMIGNGDINPIERELSDMIGNVRNDQDIGPIFNPRDMKRMKMNSDIMLMKM